MPYQWPLNIIQVTQAYGVNKNRWPYGAFGHPGIDLRTSFADSRNPYREVYASGDGVVLHTNRYTGGYGHHVILEHPDGCTTLYGHFSQIICKEGQAVRKGERIGISGSTGISTGPHLHWEARNKDGHLINPLSLLPQGIEDHYPVEDRYSIPLNREEEIKFMSFNGTYIYNNLARLFVAPGQPYKKRPPTLMEANALIYGHWSIEEVADPAMFEVWTVKIKGT